ncbi:MAG: sigma-54-dependent Fis family transcriptional regulator, partial [Acidobacteria bacterium]|nr:sigma-54-dependent Fis family transcriptional regulator [Acidobacteriota bacterium]
MAWTILLVEDQPSVREAYALHLTDLGYVVHTAASGEEALSLLDSMAPDLMVLDLVLPHMSGLEILGRVRKAGKDLPVIMLTARGTVRDAVEAMRLGAYDFVAKTIDMDDLQLALQRVTEFLAVTRQVQVQSGRDFERYALNRVIAESVVMKPLMQQVQELTRNEQITVLLQGETGTGKQFMGRVIHFNSSRAQKPYIEIDCPAIPHDLFESELFGHEKGSFTGATGRKCGLLEMGDGGTILFDEIGDLPLMLQTKLLKVLEDRRLRRIGGQNPIPVDVRFMAATNRNLRDAVTKGEFREDLYFRLNVVKLTIPPLRERPEDIIPLAERLLVQYAIALKKPVRTLGDSARLLLQQYAFPGNVRELSNLIERAVLFCQGSTIEATHFPSDLKETSGTELQESGKTIQPPSPSGNSNQISLSFRVGEH